MTPSTQQPISFYAGECRLFLAIIAMQAKENKDLRAQLEAAYDESENFANLLAAEWGIAD